MEAKIEQLLTWMLAPAVHGIPKICVPGAAERAGELLSQHGRDVEAAVREVVAGSERTVSALVLNFCLERIPILGCPTILLRSTWGNLRSILIIAALYGHDLEAPRVQHEALLCLVPPGKYAEDASFQPRNDWAHPLLVSETAQRVAGMLIRGALRRATGLQAAVDCFELASLLYSSVGQDSGDDDGFVHVLATPASAARDLFRRKSFASCALLWCSLPLLALGMAAPALFAAARLAPAVAEALRQVARRLPAQVTQSAPALILLAIAGGATALPRCRCRQARQRRSSLSFLSAAALWWPQREGRTLQEAWPQILTLLVFTLHALLPTASIYSAVSVICGAFAEHPSGDECAWGMLHRASCAALGLYSLFSTLLHRLQGESLDVDCRSAGGAAAAAARALRVAAAASRCCCVLAAWTYASVFLDLGTSLMANKLRYLRPDADASALGVIGPLAWVLGADRRINPLMSERAAAFLLNLVSVACQQRLVELLSRREVLLRLIGAERVMASTLCLLLKGVAVACNNAKNGANPIAEFLTKVAPPPVCCVVVVALRDQALMLGALLALAPRAVSSGFLGTAPSFAAGLAAGAYLAHALLGVWYTSHADLDSPALRLALLIPGVPSHAKGILRHALFGARTRAVRLMAMGIYQRAMRWVRWRA